MAFLTINGWEIPVAEVTKSTEYLGTYKRVFNGSLRDSTSAVKRKWNITTTPLTYDDAYTLRNILISNGDHFGFDNIAGNTGWDTTIGNFIVSDKGVVATSGTATWRPLEGPNNLNAIAVEKNTTNLLSQNAASFETDLTGWTIVQTGITFSNPSDGGYHGSKYCKLVGSSGDTNWALQSPFISGGGITGGASISFSWYEKHNIDLSSVSGGNEPIIAFYNDTSKISEVSLTNLGPANIQWHRHSITAVAPSGTTKIIVRVGYNTPDLNSFQYHCIDAVQVEVNSIPTSFSYPSRSSNPAVISNFYTYNPREMSILFGINPLEINAGAVILDIGSTINYGWTFWVGFNGTNGAYRIVLIDNNGIRQDIYITSAMTLGSWNKAAVIFNSTQGKVKSFLNGNKTYEGSVSYSLTPTISNSIDLGYPSYQSFLLSDLLILPFAVSDSFATAYTNTNTYYKMPYVTISGDIVNNQQVICFPEVQDFDYLQFSNNGTWTTGQKVKFSLLEV